jgi:predicted ATPase
MHELPQQPSALLLDEVENGLHPHLLGRFISMLQAYAAQRGTQVIVTTHSPITVNFSDSPDNVVIVERSGAHPRVTSLRDAHAFEKLSQHFDLGELWYNVGESKLVR